jgi:hypothetical protein
MELILYELLGTRSRRAIFKTHRRTHAYQRTLYVPRLDLVQRLSRETGLSHEQVYEQMRKERDYLLGRDNR